MRNQETTQRFNYYLSGDYRYTHLPCHTLPLVLYNDSFSSLLSTASITSEDIRFRKTKFKA
ncbi:MAG: hypothetical protein AAF564_20965, partial [Bacteroidota bacterium]